MKYDDIGNLTMNEPEYTKELKPRLAMFDIAEYEPFAFLLWRSPCHQEAYQARKCNPDHAKDFWMWTDGAPFPDIEEVAAMPLEAKRQLLHTAPPKPKYPIGTLVRTVGISRLRVKRILWSTYCFEGRSSLKWFKGTYEYVLEDTTGHEVHSSVGLGTFSEGSLTVAEGYLEEFIRLQKQG